MKLTRETDVIIENPTLPQITEQLNDLQRYRDFVRYFGSK